MTSVGLGRSGIGLGSPAGYRTASLEHRLLRPLAVREERAGGALGFLVVVLAVGYLAIGRAFSYIGISSVDIFVGEVVLLGLAAHPVTRSIFTEAVQSLTRSTPFTLLNTLLLSLIVFGVFQLARGLQAGFDPLIALQNLPFDYYPLFLLVGAWATRGRDNLLPRVTWWLAIVNGTYGALYVVALSHLTNALPGSPDVPLFTTGSGSALALLGLLAYHQHRQLTLPLAALNVFVLLGNQQRSEWIGLVVGLLIWCLATRQIRLLVQGALVSLLALFAISLSGISVPGAEGRGGTVSIAGVFGRLVAVVDPSLAARYTTDSAMFAGTASWRSQWWHDIWASSNSSMQLRFLGHGYGYPLHSLTTFVPPDTRTPHSVFFYALGYTGWVGVILLALLWVVIVSLLVRHGRATGDWFGLMAFGTVVAFGLFGNWFETPFGGVPSYLLVGLALGTFGRSSATVPPPDYRTGTFAQLARP